MKQIQDLLFWIFSFLMVKGKKILLGITGSIAAYKSALLVRLLVKEGAEVKVLMTSSARDFITPLTMSVLSKNPVISEYYDPADGSWNNHVELGLWADALVIAPASANTLAKMANGLVDNVLLATYLSARCPVFIAPAMDLDMWKHPATQSNLDRLKSFGHHLISPATGELASGLHGEGRMEEPENIFKALNDFFLTGLPLKGKKALVTAGPTYESIDPVRFIGNRSSGMMGYRIAEELSRQGAEVKLVSGPSHEQIRTNSVSKVDVESAEEMYNACMDAFDNSDIIVMAAAVADYRPANISEVKIKKSNNEQPLTLIPTQDILKKMGEKKRIGQFLVGFALETNDELKHAKEKLTRKNLDLVVLNSLRDEGAGFKVNTNKVTIIDRSGNETRFDLKSKSEVAKDVVNEIVRLSAK